MRIIETVKEFDEVINTNNKVLVDFYADWCGPCKMLAPVLEKISANRPNDVIVKVNVYNLGEIAQRYGIMSIPTLIVFENGQVKNTSIGFVPQPQIEKLLND